jgi:hypothetical protein
MGAALIAQAGGEGERSRRIASWRRISGSCGGHDRGALCAGRDRHRIAGTVVDGPSHAQNANGRAATSATRPSVRESLQAPEDAHRHANLRAGMRDAHDQVRVHRETGGAKVAVSAEEAVGSDPLRDSPAGGPGSSGAAAHSVTDHRGRSCPPGMRPSPLSLDPDLFPRGLRPRRSTWTLRRSGRWDQWERTDSRGRQDSRA